MALCQLVNHSINNFILNNHILQLLITFPIELMFHNSALTRERPEKSSEPTEHFCDQAERHGHQPIKYICLDDACALNRKCCKQCVMEKHRRHRVGSIDKLIAPLNCLSINSHTEHSHEHHTFFKEKIQEVIGEWDKMTELFEKCKEHLSNTVILEMQAIKNTFSSQDIDRAYDLMHDPNATIEQINDYVKIINFLDKKEGLDDVEVLRAQVSRIAAQTTSSMRKASVRIEALMHKLMGHFTRYTFNPQHGENNNDDTVEADNHPEVRREEKIRKEDRKQERKEERKQERKSEKKEEARDERREQKKDTKPRRPDEIRQDNKKKESKPNKESNGNPMQKYNERRFGDNKKFGEQTLEQNQDNLYYDSADEEPSPPGLSYTQPYGKSESEQKVFNLFHKPNDQKTRYK